MSRDKKQLTKLLSFMATFDGGLYRRTNRHGNLGNATFIMNMKKTNLDYVEWVADTLNELVGTRITPRPDYNTDGCMRQPQVRLESKSHPVLSTLHERIYIDGKKVIDPHMLKLLDGEALAIIFMADGSVSAAGDVNLNTKGFSYGDNMILSKAIYGRLGIQTNINRNGQYFYLRVPKKNNAQFYAAVAAYVKPSFSYKLERLAPWFKGDEIVWPSQECGEDSRKDCPHEEISHA